MASSGLGTVLVDGQGRTLYVFSADRPGASARLGVLLRVDGRRQLTIDGLPAYTNAGDGAAGATTGEGKGLDAGVFTAVDASGAAIPAPVTRARTATGTTTAVPTTATAACEDEPGSSGCWTGSDPS